MTGNDNLAVPASAREEFGLLYECDLDLLLVLDGRTGGPLVPFLLDAVSLKPAGPFEVKRSVLRQAGTRETDIEVSWPGGALLIENKIDAEFTASQPASYRQEVVDREQRGETVRSVLLCPSRRTATLGSLAGSSFDATITYEDLADIADRHGDRLSRAVATTLRAACTARLGQDPVRSSWGAEYRTVLTSVVPPGRRLALGPKSFDKTNSIVANFGDTSIDPGRVWKLQHHVLDGLVRMELDVRDEHLDALPPGVVVRRKPRMRYLDIPVPPMSFAVRPADQRAVVHAAAQAALALREWAETHLSGLPYDG